MNQLKVNYGMPFKAQVQSQNPLISGDWKFIGGPNNSVPTAPQPQKPKKSKLVPILLTVAALGLTAFGLSKARGTESIKKVVEGGWENAKGILDKVKFCIGKLGDYVNIAWNKTIGRLHTPKIAEDAANNTPSA